MSNKTKKETHSRILNELRLHCRKLLLSSEYKEGLMNIYSIEDKMMKATNRGEFEELEKEYHKMEDTMNERYGCFFCEDTLKELLDDESLLFQTFGEQRKILDYIQLRPFGFNKTESGDTELTDWGILDDKGYVHIKVNPLAPRRIIHFQLDRILTSVVRNVYGSKEDTRFRKERIQALQVWEKRRLREPFKQIAKELGIKEPAAKKAFYKAYELIYGKKYDPAGYEKPEIKKEYLKKTCNACMEKSTCKELCPDVIEFVKQGASYQRERILPYRKPRPKEDQDSL